MEEQQDRSVSWRDCLEQFTEFYQNNPFAKPDENGDTEYFEDEDDIGGGGDVDEEEIDGHATIPHSNCQ